MTDSTPVLIAAIESEPILYDRGRSDFKDLGKKRDVWRSVAAKVGLTAQEAERRWRHVRDGFSKYRRRRLRATLGFGSQAVKEYKYARMLTFLNPFKADPPTPNSWPEMSARCEYSMLVNDVSVESEAGPVLEPPQVVVKSEPDAEPELPVPKSELEAPASSFPPDEDSRGSYPEDMKPSTDECAGQEVGSLGAPEDDLDLFMRAMAHTIRKLPQRQRAVLKYQIHALVHKAEMEFYNDWSLS